MAATTLPPVCDWGVGRMVSWLRDGQVNTASGREGTGLLVLALSVTYCVTLDKPTLLSDPHFSATRNDNDGGGDGSQL